MSDRGSWPRPAPAAVRASLVSVDFDGTLAPIVDDPTQAVPGPGAVAAVEELARVCLRVLVVSGRPLRFLRRYFDDHLVTLVASYGLETADRGEVELHPQAGSWVDVITDVATASRQQGPPEMEVEEKGLSLTLHYRRHPEIAGQVADWAAGQAGRSGLEVRPAKLSVELHPPVRADKGTAILSYISGVSGVSDGDDAKLVVHIGDDVGDLPAFDALDRLRNQGRQTLRVAVDGDEVPALLIERADLVLDGPPEVPDFLRHLRDIALEA